MFFKQSNMIMDWIKFYPVQNDWEKMNSDLFDWNKNYSDQKNTIPIVFVFICGVL